MRKLSTARVRGIAASAVFLLTTAFGDPTPKDASEPSAIYAFEGAPIVIGEGSENGALITCAYGRGEHEN